MAEIELNLREIAQFIQTADQTIANTLTETTILGSGIGTLTLPANFFTLGKTLRLTILGYYSTNGEPTLTIKTYCDAVNIHDSGAQNMAKDITNQAFEIRTVLTCRTVGITGTIYAQGKAIFYTTKNTSIEISLENISTTIINTTIPCALDIRLTWGTAHAGNIITSTNTFLEILK